MRTLSIFNTITLKPFAVILDILAVGVVYMVPTFSHMLNLPLYYAEPMRLMVILALLHTSHRNAYFLAVTLPLFSFITSGHPHMIKSMLIATELVFNVWFFIKLRQMIPHWFTRMFTSILLSKTWYYLVKFILIKLLLIDSGLISTPPAAQIIMLAAFSLYAYLIYRKKNITSEGKN